MSILHWIKQILIAIDQLANVLVTPFHSGAWADETLSSRAWRMEQEGKPWGKIFRPIIDLMFFWQKDHCKNAFESERARRQSPPEHR